jgi:transposase
MTVAVQELVNGVWKTRTYSCSLSGPAFQRFLDSLQKDDLILVEATTISFWFYDQVIDRVDACNILNTHQLDSYGNKTDKIDAKRLVRILAYNEQMEPELQRRPYIYVPAKEVRDLRALFTTFTLTKKMITQVANRIHSLYKQNGKPLERKKLYSRSFREDLAQQPVLSGMAMVQVCSLLNQFDTLEAEKKQLHDLICYLGVKLFGEEVKLLLGIKGFSCLTATALMCDIVCVDRFPSAKKFCSYLRTAPRISASNQTLHLGKVNKQGRALTCTLLTQSVAHFPKVPHFGEFKERIKKGKKACTVRMALIRKILVSAYYMLSRKQAFRWIDRDSYERKIKKMNRIVNKYSQGGIKEARVA